MADEKVIDDNEDYITDAEGLTKVATALLKGWEAHPGDSIEMGQRGRRPDAGRFLGVFGLAAHVHRTGAIVLELGAQGLVFEAMPLIRLMWESSLTAMWLAQNPDGGGALANEEVRKRRAAVKTMARTKSPTLQRSAAVDDFPGLDAEPFGTSSNEQAKVFESMCNDLDPGGADAYIHYRVMSRYCHAGIHLVEQYLIPNESKDDVEAVSPQPRPVTDEGLWLYYVVCSLVWAGTSMDYLDPSRARRSELRQAATAVGVQRDLHLTDAARQRVVQAQTARRRAGWKGKNPRKA